MNNNLAIGRQKALIAFFKQSVLLKSQPITLDTLKGLYNRLAHKAATQYHVESI